MKKLVIGLLSVILLAGCGSSSGNDKSDDKTIRVGASTTPHAEIIKFIQPQLEEEGYKVEITEFTDYVTPNIALVDGDLDVNFFQHEPYMKEWAEKAKATDKIMSIFAVHFEPLGIYSTKYTSLEEVKEGMKIAIPNDPTNGGRALKLLEDQKIIKLKEGKGVDATKADIDVDASPIKVEITEMAAEACAKNIDDVDFAVVNGNNALLAKISDRVLAIEAKDSDAAKTYANIIAVSPDHQDDAKVKALIDALNTEAVRSFIEETYKGIVVPLVPKA